MTYSTRAILNGWKIPRPLRRSLTWTKAEGTSVITAIKKPAETIYWIKLVKNIFRSEQCISKQVGLKDSYKNLLMLLMFLQECSTIWLSQNLFTCMDMGDLMHVLCIYDELLTSLRIAFILQSICWHSLCVISSVRRRRCEDVVGDIHYKLAHQPIKALFCGGDQARGRLRLCTETPVVRASSSAAALLSISAGGLHQLSQTSAKAESNNQEYSAK